MQEKCIHWLSVQVAHCSYFWNSNPQWIHRGAVPKWFGVSSSIVKCENSKIVPFLFSYSTPYLHFYHKKVGNEVYFLESYFVLKYGSVGLFKGEIRRYFLGRKWRPPLMNFFVHVIFSIKRREKKMVFSVFLNNFLLLNPKW